MIAGHNPSFDRDFLRHAAMRAHLNWPFAHRTIDSHSVCWTHMTLQKIKPPMKNQRSALDLDAVLVYCGLPEEPNPHNALVGAQMEAEGFSRLLDNKKLLEEFEKYEIPWV